MVKRKNDYNRTLILVRSDHKRPAILPVGDGARSNDGVGAMEGRSGGASGEVLRGSMSATLPATSSGSSLPDAIERWSEEQPPSIGSGHVSFKQRPSLKRTVTEASIELEPVYEPLPPITERPKGGRPTLSSPSFKKLSSRLSFGNRMRWHLRSVEGPLAQVQAGHSPCARWWWGSTHGRSISRLHPLGRRMDSNGKKQPEAVRTIMARKQQRIDKKIKMFEEKRRQAQDLARVKAQLFIYGEEQQVEAAVIIQRAFRR